VLADETGIDIGAGSLYNSRGLVAEF